jgi:hypothetical protein
MARKTSTSLIEAIGIHRILGIEDNDEDTPKISKAADNFLEWFEVQLKNFGEMDIDVRDGGIIKSVPAIEVLEERDLALHFIKAMWKRFIGIKMPEDEAMRELKQAIMNNDEL